jgi:hypothetical protein
MSGLIASLPQARLFELVLNTRCGRVGLSSCSFSFPLLLCSLEACEAVLPKAMLIKLLLSPATPLPNVLPELEAEIPVTFVIGEVPA